MKVAVAMSGGVDSSVAAALLLAEGQEVVGLTLRMQEEDERSSGALARARGTARLLGVPHQIVDCVREFGEEVLRPAWEEYSAGRTPSPCLRCNERIKFGLLLPHARELGAAHLATGHYARVVAAAGGRPSLLRGLDAEKDQSYFLAGLSLEQLGSVRFPLGALRKAEVRERARLLALPAAETAESQDACLVGDEACFAERLRERFGASGRPGPLLDGAGQVVGQHAGLHLFTVGQRKGLSVRSIRRHWVQAIRPDDASIVVTSDERDLYADRLTASEVSWLEEPDGGSRRCQVQIRYRHAAAPATLERTGPSSVRVLFDEPVRAVTPGQAAVFFDGERVLGRGWIACLSRR